MFLYDYKAKDAQGKAFTGIIEGTEEKQVANLLRERGFFVIDLKKKQTLSVDSIFKFYQRAGFSDVVLFTRELSTMITAGLPLTEGLEILRRQTRNPDMGKNINDILEKVQGGMSLADALSYYPNLFSKVYVSLVRSGESAGVLDTILGRLADNLEKDREFKAKTRGALVYPAIVVSAMVVVMIIMMVFVVPKLLELYKDFGTELPLPTRILMGISDFSVKFFPILVPLLIGLVFMYRGWVNTPSGRRKMDEIIFDIPVFGRIRKGTALTEFTRTFGLLISTGIPILEALHIVSQTLGNRVYQDAIEEAAKEVERGFPLGVPLSRNPDFPIILGQMLKVGEETGKMDDVLSKLSKYFESETENLIKGLTTAIEPVIMIVLGIGVGLLVFAVILPIYNLTNQF